MPSRAQAPEPVAVVLDLVKPIRAVRDDLRAGGDTELEHVSERVRGGAFEQHFGSVRTTL